MHPRRLIRLAVLAIKLRSLDALLALAHIGSGVLLAILLPLHVIGVLSIHRILIPLAFFHILNGLRILAVPSGTRVWRLTGYELAILTITVLAFTLTL